MNDFFQVSWDQSKPGSPYNGEESFSTVFEAIDKLKRASAYAPVDIDNLEAVFVAFEMAQLCGIQLTEAPEREPVNAIRDLILLTLDEALTYRISDAVFHPHESYGPFIRLLKALTKTDGKKRKHRIDVITFNYDPQVDMAMFAAGLNFGYCLDGDVPSSRLLKLHGSMLWPRCNACTAVNLDWTKSVLRNLARKDTFRDDTQEAKLRISRDIKKGKFDCPNGCLKPTWEPIIVPPTWSKGQHYQSLERVWSSAAAALSEAENIIVCGYSLPDTDQFFRFLVSMGTLHNRQLRRFWIFDPNPEVRDRFLRFSGPSLKPKIEAWPLKFDQACEFLQFTDNLTKPVSELDHAYASTRIK